MIFLSIIILCNYVLKCEMYISFGLAGILSCVMNIFNPASSTKYTMMEFQTATQYLASSTAVHLGRKGFGLLEVAEAHTGIQVYASSAIITVAKLSVYGVL